MRTQLISHRTLTDIFFSMLSLTLLLRIQCKAHTKGVAGLFHHPFYPCWRWNFNVLNKPVFLISKTKCKFENTSVLQVWSKRTICIGKGVIRFHMKFGLLAFTKTNMSSSPKQGMLWGENLLLSYWDENLCGFYFFHINISLQVNVWFCIHIYVCNKKHY